MSIYDVVGPLPFRNQTLSKLLELRQVKHDVARPMEDRSRLTSREFFEHAAAGLRIVHDAEYSQEYAQAHDWLSLAHRTHLLGFGFHPTNVRRLDLKSLRGKRRHWGYVGGTSFGLEEAERTRAVREIEPAQHHELFLAAADYDCLKYLRAMGDQH